MLELTDIHHRYRKGKHHVTALAGLSLSVTAGDYLAITGVSGSGKSTLLNILGLLAMPTAGSYRIAGVETAGLADKAASRLRNHTFGFVFQSFHLIPERRAWQNVALPLEYRKPRLSSAERKQRALDALARVGLSERAEHYPSELSGGQEQRVAIARALVNTPEVILADEPTGNLDSATRDEILTLLESLNAQGVTLVVVTHDPSVASRAGRQLRLLDGRVIDERGAAGGSILETANGRKSL
jgi:putative ABC transport system ATP-binding protein